MDWDYPTLNRLAFVVIATVALCDSTRAEGAEGPKVEFHIPAGHAHQALLEVMWATSVAALVCQRFGLQDIDSQTMPRRSKGAKAMHKELPRATDANSVLAQLTSIESSSTNIAERRSIQDARLALQTALLALEAAQVRMRRPGRFGGREHPWVQEPGQQRLRSAALKLEDQTRKAIAIAKTWGHVI